jgi:putative flippase GtrA
VTGSGKSLTELARRILAGGGTSGKAARFGLIGVLSGAIYIAVAGALVHAGLLGPALSGVIGYLASMPINFVGNRSWSFRSEGSLVGDLTRYVVLHAANIMLAAATMSLVIEGLRLHVAAGLLATVVVIPVANFIAMNLWVFRRRSSQSDTTA